MGAGASVPNIVTLDAALAHTGPLGIADARVTEAFGGKETLPGPRAMELLAAMQEESKHARAAEVGTARAAVRAMLEQQKEWDDGSLTPVFIRLAWHSSGTYDAATKTGGSNGAGMRFGPEAGDPENAGLDKARAFIEPLKAQFPNFSYSDLWILAAYVGLEVSGGPVIPFTAGRVDYDDETAATYPPVGRLPAAEKGIPAGCPFETCDAVGVMHGWEALAEYMRTDIFYRMGFDDREAVALLCGGHVYGRCHTDRSGYAGAWVAEMTQFSNEYAADMLEDTWTCVDHDDVWLDDIGAAELRPAPGKKQYVNRERPAGWAPKDGKALVCPFSFAKAEASLPTEPPASATRPGCPFAKAAAEDAEPEKEKCASSAGGEPDNQMMLASDMVLAWDKGFRVHLEAYAEDEDALRTDFGKAFKKLTELGCPFAEEPARAPTP